MTKVKCKKMVQKYRSSWLVGQVVGKFLTLCICVKQIVIYCDILELELKPFLL